MCILSGFDGGDISEDTSDDLEGLDASAAHVANLLSTEPTDSMFSCKDLQLMLHIHRNASASHWSNNKNHHRLNYCPHILPSD